MWVVSDDPVKGSTVRDVMLTMRKKRYHPLLKFLHMNVENLKNIPILWNQLKNDHISPEYRDQLELQLAQMLFDAMPDLVWIISNLDALQTYTVSDARGNEIGRTFSDYDDARRYAEAAQEKYPKSRIILHTPSHPLHRAEPTQPNHKMEMIYMEDRYKTTLQ